jgi:hypothetical protein
MYIRYIVVFYIRIYTSDKIEIVGFFGFVGQLSLECYTMPPLGLTGDMFSKSRRKLEGKVAKE